MTDSSFVNAFSQNHSCYHNECSDISTHSEHAHSACVEDDVFMNDLKYRYNKSQNVIGTLPDLNINLKNSFISSIWQPPKFS
jgi:hypothetical protein